MKGNKALKRAIQSKDYIRISNPEVPLITDTTELVDPGKAREFINNNKHNRQINWRRVEQYAEQMKTGNWHFHAQGIILDKDGNILSGQHVLWAIIYAGVTIPLRISRGTPASAAKYIDRGAPQSARDLASRDTERRHSPTEASIARAVFVLRGNMKPSTDDLGNLITALAEKSEIILKGIRGMKRTKAVVMVIAAIIECYPLSSIDGAVKLIPRFVERLESNLEPENADKCWGRGAAFSLAMRQAQQAVKPV